MSWAQVFDDPIELPDGRVLRTLRDAGEFIQGLPKATHDLPEWQDAVQALLLVVDHDGDTLLAHIGIVRALNARKAAALEPQPRHKAAKKHRIIR